MRSIFRVGEWCKCPAPTRNLLAALGDFDLPTRGRLIPAQFHQAFVTTGSTFEEKWPDGATQLNSKA
jgi:hypothetical protein